jgi:hypothetical protein
LRVFFTGAFHAPRQFNWVIGAASFLVILFSNFTGYLLPWDQLAFWAVTICTGMLEYIPRVGLWMQRLIQGGPEVGPGTLSNFYALHTAILPLFLLILMPFHFWRIRKAGGLVIPRQPGQSSGDHSRSVSAIPNLLLREVVAALVLFACMLVFSMLVNAPLGSKANPGLGPNPTKAPWYFMGIHYRLDHSLRIPRPDLGEEIGTPNACNRCHIDKTVQWSVDAVNKWYGPGRRAYYGALIEAGRRRLPEAKPDLIRLAADPLYPVIVRSTALSLLTEYPGEDTVRALGLEPSNMDYLYAVAEFYLKRNRSSEAKRVAERMVAAHPDQRIGRELLKLIERRRISRP